MGALAKPGLFVFAILLGPGCGQAFAHAFGARYDLPLPFGHYVVGACAVVVLSFLIAAASPRFLGRKSLPFQVTFGPLKGCHWVTHLLRGLGVLAFGLIVVAGLIGADSPTGNIAPLLVWVIWWVGFLFFCAFVANLWPLLDPWRTIFDWAASRQRDKPRRSYSARLSGWPAVVLFFLFAWMELVGGFGETPRLLAIAILCYSALAWAAMAIFGQEMWLERIDPFHRVFGLFGRFAPIGVGSSGRAIIRLPGAGLLGDHPRDLSEVAFVVLVLATVTFDGFSETPIWAGILEWISNSQALRPVLVWISGLGVNLLATITTAGLLCAPILFLGIFLVVSWASARLGGGVTCGQVSRAFALTLLPIAIAYHLSHYLSYLLLAGQMLAPLASDPFGFGWDLFGWADLRIDISIIGAKTVWFVAICAIVAGHVISVILAHIEALRLFPTAGRAFLSQLPMLALMVAFTGCSLWILAQPVVQ